MLDASPLSWGSQSPPISLREAVASLLVFANSHLSLNHSNEIAVLAAHPSTVRFLYPLPPSAVEESGSSSNLVRDDSVDPVIAAEDADESNIPTGTSMYKQFRVVNEAVMDQLEDLISKTTEKDITSKDGGEGVSDTSMISGALSMALAYINRQTGGDVPTTEESSAIKARILLVSVCSDLAAQYVPIMNCIFAAQKMASS